LQSYNGDELLVTLIYKNFNYFIIGIAPALKFECTQLTKTFVLDPMWNGTVDAESFTTATQTRPLVPKTGPSGSALSAGG
jgi:hypothetical protein